MYRVCRLRCSGTLHASIIGRMAVPAYQTLMLPVLEFLADGARRSTLPDITDHLARHFHLTEEDLAERFTSGQPTYYNRTHWAVTYLAKAGVIARVARGKVAIRQRGKDILATKPDHVDANYLRRYPEFQEFMTKTRERDAPPSGQSLLGDSEANPEELLFGTYESLRQTVEADILDRLQSDALSWSFFEQLVVDVLVRMGFGSDVEETSRRVTRKSGDDGIDGVIDEDRLGLDAVYVQAKRYAKTSPVGRPALQAFAGSLEGQRASKGVFITTSHFTGEAEDYVKRISKRIVLIDGKTLARLMYEYGVGVRTRRTLDVKRVDEAYFEGDV
jgi:restriction system protein